MNVLIVLPLLFPLLGASLSLLAWRRRRIQRWLALICSFGLFVSALFLLDFVWRSGIQTMQLGAWMAPFGISLVVDLFAGIMLVVTGVMGFSVCVYSVASVDARRETYGYYPLLLILLLGVSGAFMTGDIFNLYVWFEVMLMASFMLLALGGERSQMGGAIKYVTLNLMASALFLVSVGIIFGKLGTLNMADLSGKLYTSLDPGLVTTVAILFLLAFGIKAAIFPLFFWLPESYHTPPVPVSAIFAALLTKVGVYAMIRVFTLLFVQDVEFTHRIILILAGFTMVTGVLGAVAQTEFRKLLSFHIVSQIGYLLMGLGLYTQTALAGSIFFMIHVIAAKSALFLVSGVAYRYKGTFDLKKLGGLYASSPVLAALFLIPAMSLAGMPPLSGFFGKLILVQAGLEIQQYAIVGVALGTGLLTLLSMTKIWTEAFWKPGRESTPPGGSGSRLELSLLFGPIILLAAVTVFAGLAAGPLFSLAEEAAGQLLNPAGYIEAVMQ
jgi:multicomponent Na+:H+ antiporter subunit D